MRGDVLLSRFIKLPVPATFIGVLANSGTITGLGFTNTILSPVALGTITQGRRYKGPRLIFGVSSTNGSNFSVQIQGNNDLVTQDYFTKVIVEDGAGTPQELLTASATSFSDGGGGPTALATWNWGDGLARIWETGDATETKKVYLI